MSPRSPSGSTSFSRIACVMRRALAFGNVWEQAELAGALYRRRELALVAPAGSRDPRGADLALLAHRPAKRAEVLVVDDVDLVAAERAWLGPGPSRGALAYLPSAGLLAAAVFCLSGLTFSPTHRLRPP